jgi:hypothetical protein
MGLGTESEKGVITGLPSFTAWRNWFLGIDLGLLESLKIQALLPSPRGESTNHQAALLIRLLYCTVLYVVH